MHFDLQEHTFWANNLLKRGKRRLISDIRRSIGDGQTLVYVLETLGKNGASLFDIDIIQYLVACNVYDCLTVLLLQTNKANIAPLLLLMSAVHVSAQGTKRHMK